MMFGLPVLHGADDDAGDRGQSWVVSISGTPHSMLNSPFGPFRIDIAKALLKEKGDNTKTFQFNVGTQF